MHDLADLVLDVGDLMIAGLVGAATYAAAASAPRWLTGLGIVVAAAWTLGAAAVIATDGPFAGANGPYGTAIVALLIAWMLANSTRALRR